MSTKKRRQKDEAKARERRRIASAKYAKRVREERRAEREASIRRRIELSDAGQPVIRSLHVGTNAGRAEEWLKEVHECTSGYFSAQHMAEFIGVPYSTFMDWVRDGRFPANGKHPSYTAAQADKLANALSIGLSGSSYLSRRDSALIDLLHDAVK